MTELLKATGIKLLNYLNKPISVFQYFVSATIIISLFVFSGFWKNLINTLWVTPIMSHLGGYEILIAILYSLILIRYYWYICYKKWNISQRRLTLWSIYTIIYLCCYFSGDWNYTLIFENCKFSAWTHLSLLPFICELILFKCLQRDYKDDLKLLEIEKTVNISDSYKRNAVCSTTFNVLKTCFDQDCSFSVAITGVWGSGKTTFLNSLRKQYHNNKINIIVFEPWKSDSPDLIIHSFFTLLRNELNGYVPNISSLIDEYILTLIDEEVIKPVKWLNKSMKWALAMNDKNIYEQIKKELSDYKHKIVVFIDDIDRLNADEIREVLRLVRNTANFPYIQFITAYDKNYLIKILKNDGLDNSERYLEKFFNVEITLPKYEERIICKELYSRVSKLISDNWKLDADFGPIPPSVSVITTH